MSKIREQGRFAGSHARTHARVRCTHARTRMRTHVRTHRWAGPLLRYLGESGEIPALLRKGTLRSTAYARGLALSHPAAPHPPRPATPLSLELTLLLGKAVSRWSRRGFVGCINDVRRKEWMLSG